MSFRINKIELEEFIAKFAKIEFKKAVKHNAGFKELSSTLQKTIETAFSMGLIIGLINSKKLEKEFIKNQIKDERR